MGSCRQVARLACHEPYPAQMAELPRLPPAESSHRVGCLVCHEACLVQMAELPRRVLAALSRPVARLACHELVALHFGERPGFSSGRQISGSLPLDSEPLNRPARVLVNDVVIRAVIIDHIVLNVDVGHVHCVRDVSDVLRWRIEPIPQNRFTDKTNVAKVVIFRADIVFDVHGGADGLSFIDAFRTTRWQGRPADAVSTGSPRYPSRSPVQIAAWDPDPAVIR